MTKVLIVFSWLISMAAISAQVQIPGYSPNQSGSLPLADLPKFNLDFQGGSPEELIMHINEELKTSPVNVIIPKEYNDAALIPPMKLKNVTVQQVFEALARTSQKRVTIPTSFVDYGAVGPAGIPSRRTSFQEQITSYSFQAIPPISTNSVWYFVLTKPAYLEETKVCQFYQLGPYLEQGLNINDITTAIQAGYKMLGEESAPELNFHEETKLLIAVGSDSKLKLIDQVLSQLPKAKPAEAAKDEKPKS